MAWNIIKRGIYILLFFFIMSSLASADYQTVVYSGTINDDGKTTVDGKDINVHINGKKVLVEYDSGSFLLLGDECEKNGNTEVCLNGVEEDYSASIAVYRKVANVVVTKKAANDGPVRKDDVFTVNIDIENKDGGYRAENLVLIENVSDGLLFVDSTGCEMVDGTIKLEITLYKNDNIRCSYRVIPLRGGEFVLNTIITYFDGSKEQRIKKETEIKVLEYGLGVVAEKFPKDKFDIGERIRFKFNLTNTFPYHVDVTNLILKPKFFKIYETDLNGLSDNTYSWYGLISGNKSKTFFIEGEIQGFDNTIEFDIDYSGDNKKDKSTPKLNFKVDVITPEIRFDKYNKKYKKDEDVKIYFRNPSSKVINDFFDLDINMRSNILDKERSEKISLLPAGEEKLFILNKKEMPDGKYPLFVRGSYKTQFGEIVSFDRTEFIEINETKPAEKVPDTNEENITINSNELILKDNSTINETGTKTNILNFIEWSGRKKFYIYFSLLIVLIAIIAIFLLRRRNRMPELKI